jgi:predicted RNA-binding Zn-ribbon protein involved in translation (DUF1610 family)
MELHICTSCNFRFETRDPGDCPYCGRNDIERNKSASELLDEVEGLLRE